MIRVIDDGVTPSDELVFREVSFHQVHHLMGPLHVVNGVAVAAVDAVKAGRGAASAVFLLGVRKTDRQTREGTPPILSDEDFVGLCPRKVQLDVSVGCIRLDVPPEKAGQLALGPSFVAPSALTTQPARWVTSIN